LLGESLFGFAPEFTFAAINCLAGVVGFWAIYVISRLLGDSRTGKIAIMLCAFSSGAMLLFFGHIETYAWPVALGLWSINFTIRYTRGLSSLLPAVAFALAAAAFHAIALPFLFSVLAVAVIKYLSSRDNSTGREYRFIFLIMIAGSIVFAFAGDYIGMPGVFVSLYPEPDNPYWALSLDHLRDIANALIFLAPAGILLLVASLFQQNTESEPDNENTLALFALATFLPAFWIDPALGAMRDWDLLSFYGIPLSICGACRFINRTPGYSHGAIAVGALVIVFVHLTPNLIEKRNPDTAVRFLDSALNNDPHYQITYLKGGRLLSWGTVLSHMNQNQRSKKYYERRIQAMRSSRDAWHNLGLIHIEDNKYDSAIYCFQNAVNYYAHDTTSWYMLAQAHLSLLQYREALASISRAEQLNPRDPLIHDIYGIVLMQTREYESGITHFHQSLRLEPGSDETRTNLGIAFAMARQPDSAYYHLKLALRANPDLLGIYPALLDAEIALGKYDECKRDLELLIRIDPRNAVIDRIESALRKAPGN